MTTSAPVRAGVARCRPIDPPGVGIRVEGVLDRFNAAAIAAEIVARLRERRTTVVVDLGDVVFADCTGVRLVRGALRTLDGVGVRLDIRTSDPVARVSFDLRRAV